MVQGVGVTWEGADGYLSPPPTATNTVVTWGVDAPEGDVLKEQRGE